MWRILCILSLLVTPFVSMAQEYPIHKDFRAACRITAPLGRGVLSIGNAFLGAMPKGMHSDKMLTISRVKITSTADGKRFRAWVITPKDVDRKFSAILMLHGGGFVFRGAPYHYDLAKEYALATGSVVVMPDYRTAHNHPYGTSLSDCIDTWQWMLDNAESLNIDCSHMAIVGDSAGGFLAIKATMNEDINPTKLMLIYPVVDCSMRTASMAQFSDTPVWNSKLNARMWEYYLHDMTEQSLLDLSEEQLRMFPPTYVESAEYDSLRDEGEGFATMLRGAGVNVVYTPTKGTMHGYDMAQHSSITRHSVKLRCEWLKRW